MDHPWARWNPIRQGSTWKQQKDHWKHPFLPVSPCFASGFGFSGIRLLHNPGTAKNQFQECWISPNKQAFVLQAQPQRNCHFFLVVKSANRQRSTASEATLRKPHGLMHPLSVANLNRDSRDLNHQTPWNFGLSYFQRTTPAQWTSRKTLDGSPMNHGNQPLRGWKKPEKLGGTHMKTPTISICFVQRNHGFQKNLTSKIVKQTTSSVFDVQIYNTEDLEGETSPRNKKHHGDLGMVNIGYPNQLILVIKLHLHIHVYLCIYIYICIYTHYLYIYICTVQSCSICCPMIKNGWENSSSGNHQKPLEKIFWTSPHLHHNLPSAKKNVKRKDIFMVTFPSKQIRQTINSYIS